MILQISFNLFSDVLLSSTCASAFASLYSICLKVGDVSLLPHIFVSGKLYSY